MTKTTTTRTIDLTPTWVGILYELLSVFPHADAEGRRAIYDELARPLALVDKLNGRTITVDGEPFELEGKEDD